MEPNQASIENCDNSVTPAALAATQIAATSAATSTQLATVTTTAPNVDHIDNGKPAIVETSTPGSRKRKLTSVVWSHFDRIKNIGADFEWAICKQCKTRLKAGNKHGTKSLHNHLDSCVKKNSQDISKCMQKQKLIAGNRGGDGKVQFGNFTFDQEQSRNELACAIILHEYPISIVDHVGFRRFVSSLQPLFKMVSRNTIKKDIMKIYDSEFKKLSKELEKLKSRIAITTDMWTSNQNKGYMSLTAHYVDENWQLQNRILGFVYVPSPHTKEVLANNLMDGLTKWNIETKISTITVDNCSSNDGMISILKDKLYGDLLCDGEILHMRCCAHILNLVVKDGLSAISDALLRIRDSVSFWSASPQRVEKFEEMAKQLKISCVKKLILDCKTRWNSTFLMLQTAMVYKDVFPRLKVRDKLYTNAPSDADWITAATVAEKLEIFYTTTELFSGRKYPTANCFFVAICQLRNSLVNWMRSEDEIIREMSKKMFEKFEKYWSVVHIVLGVAAVLDPRYKMKVVEYYFPMIFYDNAFKAISQVRHICYQLIDEYKSKLSRSEQKESNAIVHPSQLSECQISQKKDFKDLVAFLSSSSNNAYVKSELDYYLEESVLPWSDEFDILNWWKTNGIKYPTLQMLAKDFLAVPVSTVASESAFSTSGRVVSQHRSRLHPYTLEALMCSQNWLRASIEGSHPNGNFNSSCAMEEDAEY